MSIWTYEYFCKEICKFREEMGLRSNYEPFEGMDNLMKCWKGIIFASLQCCINKDLSKEDQEKIDNLLLSTKDEFDRRLVLAVGTV